MPLAWFGYVLSAGLALAWLILLVRARRGGPRARHPVLAAAVFSFIFASYAGFFDDGLYRGREWNLGIAAMVVGVYVFSVGIALTWWWLLGVALVGAVLAILAGSGVFASGELILPFVLVALLIASIVWRGLRGGPLPVLMSYPRRVRLNRIVLGLAAAKWLIAAVLVIG